MSVSSILPIATFLIYFTPLVAALTPSVALPNPPVAKDIARLIDFCIA